MACANTAKGSRLFARLVRFIERNRAERDLRLPPALADVEDASILLRLFPTEDPSPSTMFAGG